MAFMDDLGEKVVKTGQELTDKGKAVARMGKLKVQIAQQEHTLRELYEQIGRAYVLCHSEDADEDQAFRIAAVRQAQKEIDDCRAKIEALKKEL